MRGGDRGCCTHSGIAALCLSWLEGAPVAGDGLEWSCVRASLLEGVAVGHWYGGAYFEGSESEPLDCCTHSGIQEGQKAVRSFLLGLEILGIVDLLHI